MKISDMHKHGWIQIDPEKPINEQVSVGDYVVSTYMGDLTIAENDFFDYEKFKILSIGQRVWKVSEYLIQYINGTIVARKREDELIFVLKSSINYVTIKIPDFMLDKVKQLGGVEI